jgi:hypothetical protein
MVSRITTNHRTRVFLRIQGSHSAHRVADTICRGGVTPGKGTGRPVERCEARDLGESTSERQQSIYFLTFGIMGGQWINVCEVALGYSVLKYG